MSKLVLTQRVPRQYDAATIQDIVRQVEQQGNKLAEGSITARHGAMTAVPTTGSWVRGDLVDNSAPSAVSDAQADYVIIGWICTASGSPGTWKERRVLIEGITVPVAATQAEEESGASTTVFASPGRQHFHASSAKAWARITVSGGTPTLGQSYNVSSITDAGVGDISINLTTSFSSSSATSFGAGGDDFSIKLYSVTMNSASQARVRTIDATGSLVDSTSGVNWWAFGDQ